MCSRSWAKSAAWMNIKMVNASARAILDQVIAGEHPLALQIFNHHAAISAEKGAPVNWLRLGVFWRETLAPMWKLGSKGR